MIGLDFWRRYFKVYDVLNLLPTYRQLLSEVCEELGAKEGELVLDAGSGTGNLALKLSEGGSHVVALDYCWEALERHRTKDSNSSLILADLAKQLPFIDNCFDKIVSNNTLYTLPAEKQKNTLKEFHRVLKPGGKIALANLRARSSPLVTSLRVMGDNIRAEGLKTTARKMAALMPDMIKMAYYNWNLGRESQHHRFGLEEQRALLEDVGFWRVSETKLVYSGQGILNIAYKLADT
jgi:ubiquinone/menaquinone biosynthesis C-methylase UbiE